MQSKKNILFLFYFNAVYILIFIQSQWNMFFIHINKSRMYLFQKQKHYFCSFEKKKKKKKNLKSNTNVAL